MAVVLGRCSVAVKMHLVGLCSARKTITVHRIDRRENTRRRWRSRHSDLCVYICVHMMVDGHHYLRILRSLAASAASSASKQKANFQFPSPADDDQAAAAAHCITEPAASAADAADAAEIARLSTSWVMLGRRRTESLGAKYISIPLNNICCFGSCRHLERRVDGLTGCIMDSVLYQIPFGYIK